MIKLTLENCEYRGEGNTGIIIRLIKEEKVLRLIKGTTAVYNTHFSDHLQVELENQISVVKNVFRPLLGKTFVSVPECIFIRKEDIKNIKDWFSSQRPTFRIHKHLKEQDSYGILMPDLCSLLPELKDLSSIGPVMAIEIKPKQGFLAKEALFPLSSSARPPLRLCRHCMMQHLKMQKGTTSMKSPYCPMDLYSGCPKRMKHALKTLLAAPQNNLRIFLDNRIAYSEEKKGNIQEILFRFFGEQKCEDSLCDLLVKILTQSFRHDPTVSPMSEIITDCENAFPGCHPNRPCHELPHDCILHRIRSVQALHKLHIQDLYPLYEEMERFGKSSTNMVGCLPRREIPEHVGKEEMGPEETRHHYVSRKVWEFLVAAFAKDCFVMLVLKNYTGRDNLSDEKLVIIDEKHRYLFSVAIADLDPKPLSTVASHYHQTPLLLQVCLDSTQ